MRGLKNWMLDGLRSARSLTSRATWSALAASALLSSACGANRLVIPDDSIPHQVAQEVEVFIWARGSDGKMSQAKVRLLEGWWIAGPMVVGDDQTHVVKP